MHTRSSLRCWVVAILAACSRPSARCEALRERGEHRLQEREITDCTFALQVKHREGEDDEIALMARRAAVRHDWNPYGAQDSFSMGHADQVQQLWGRVPKAAGELKTWMIVLESDATDEEVKVLCQKLHNGHHSHPGRGEVPFVEGALTENELHAVLEMYSERVKYVEEDRFERKVVEHIDVFHGPMERRTYPWGMQDINADSVRGRGAGVNVYVLDTGIRTTHVSFGGRAFAGVDVATSGSLTVCDPSSTTCAADNHGHGTHCAGTVGASTYGVADGATIWAMKVLDDNGDGYTSWSIEAEQWILTSGLRPAVVSMSLSGAGNSKPEKVSIDTLLADGVTVVVAAGNQNTDACAYNPAYIPSAITVASYGGNSGSSSAMSPFSNYGSCVDLWAPGTYILSTYHASDTSLGVSSGTSMACAHVSGLAAIMYEAYPSAGSMTASQRWDLLTASHRTGYVTGIPATPATVNLVALVPPPTQAPTPSPTPIPSERPTIPDSGIPSATPYASRISFVTTGFDYATLAANSMVEAIFKAIVANSVCTEVARPVADCEVILSAGSIAVVVRIAQNTLQEAEATTADLGTNAGTITAKIVAGTAGNADVMSLHNSPSPITIPAGTVAVSTENGDESSAVGDPHLTSVTGKKFDVNMPGSYVLLRAPQDQRLPAKLELNATLGPFAGKPCGLYIHSIELGGEWLGDQVVDVVPLRRNADGPNGAGSGTLRPFSVRARARRAAAHAAVDEYEPWGELHQGGRGLSGHVRLVPVWRQVYADAGRPQEAQAFQFHVRGAGAGPVATLEVAQAAHQALDFRATGLRSLGFERLGGLLGTQGHDPRVERVADPCRAFRARSRQSWGGAVAEQSGSSVTASWGGPR
ncbi:unnamed protein product [Prorocentrum cordatum]|uniref:subtilisin n=1 Tax=Prorocentrum cordatum TaxID=2364126 RepID=A0ABN9SE26_9DINO|nr:unnamed protein product [Polarella glacialis]